jgi:hypothetical protein
MCAAIAASASAQLSSIGPFAGACSDDFESYPNYGTAGPQSSLVIMGGCATMNSNPSSSSQLWIYDTGSAGWGLGANGSATTSSGVQGMGLFNSLAPIDVTLQFASPVARFGGYFAVENDPTSSNTLTLTFYDASNNQIDVAQSITSSSNAMIWHGWSSTVAIDHIVFGGGVLAPVMDDLQLDPVPEPATMTALGLGLAAVAARRRRK